MSTEVANAVDLDTLVRLVAERADVLRAYVAAAPDQPEIVVAVSEFTRPLVPLPERVHWCFTDAPTDRLDKPPRDKELFTDAGLTAMQAMEVLRCTAVRTMVAGRTNIGATALRYFGGVLTLCIGVTAKGFLPRGEDPFPSEVVGRLYDGTPVTLRVDVCRG